MAEVAEQVVKTTTENKDSNISQRLQESFWEEKPTIQTVVPIQQVVEQKVEEVKQSVGEIKTEVQVPTVTEWWKTFEFNDEETAKTEIQRLKQIKPQEEIKFANDQSKQFYDYWKEGKLDEANEMWSRNKQLEKLTSGEVTEANAADIIKASLKNKYKEFSDADVDRKFNKQYSIPKEPVFDDTKETEDEFKVKHQEWAEKVSEIKADILLDAKIAKPELEQLKAKLVLPDIAAINPNIQSQKQPTPEELEADKKAKDTWVKAATNSATEFKGFSTIAKYKDGDKDIEIPVSYGLSDEEKKYLNTKLTAFAESNFDPYTILKERWVDENGNDKLDTVVKDLSWLLFGEAAAQKFATEAANQRLEIYLKDKKNININGINQGQEVSLEIKTPSQIIAEKFWGS